MDDYIFVMIIPHTEQKSIANKGTTSYTTSVSIYYQLFSEEQTVILLEILYPREFQIVEYL